MAANVKRIEKRKMRIPLSYESMGRTVRTKFRKKMSHEDGFVGKAVHQENVIYLQPTSECSPIPRESLESYYCHEVMHGMFASIGRADLSRDEAFIDQVSGLLHQFLVTSEGELKQ